MGQKIKLIWDMHGPHAKGTAEHHAVHLGEYVEKNSIDQFGFGADMLSDTHAIAFLAVDEKDMIIVRDALKPQRAEVFED